MINQQGFYFNSLNLQDSFKMALSQIILHMGHIGQHIHACLGHN